MYYLVSQEFHVDVDTVKAWPVRKTVKHILFLTEQDERMEEKVKGQGKGIPDMKGQSSNTSHSGKRQHAFQFVEKGYTIG